MTKGKKFDLFFPLPRATTLLLKPQKSSKVLVYYSHQWLQHSGSDYHLITNYHILDHLLIFVQVVCPSIIRGNPIKSGSKNPF